MKRLMRKREGWRGKEDLEEESFKMRVRINYKKIDKIKNLI